MIAAALAFLPVLLKFIPGGFLNPILKHLEAKEKSENTRHRINASVAIENIKAEKARWSAQRDIIIAEQQHWFTRWVRPVWAFPFVVYTFKVVIWDMMLQWGSTPPLGDQMYNLMYVIAGAFFLGRSGEKIAGIIKRK